MTSNNQRKQRDKALKNWISGIEATPTKEEKQIFKIAFNMGWNYRYLFGILPPEPRFVLEKTIKREIKDSDENE